ncbi:MAG: phospho-sugar mutase [Thermotogota bacterium]
MPEYETLKQQYDKWVEASSGWMKEDLQSLRTMPFEAFKEELFERFSVDAEFGTGGLRSKIRAGTNGINDFWIKRICKALRMDSKKVVIAYDTRKCSEEFALVAANTLSAGQCKIFLFDQPVPTPMLSFAVKFLECDTGIVITASHNPKTYNGFKLYDENGVQYIPDKIKRLNDQINKFSLLEKDNKPSDSQMIEKVSEDVYEAYFSKVIGDLEDLKSEQIGKREKIQVIYTPLHGTGARFVPRIMTHFGIDVLLVSKQMTPDSEFSTVNVPNPEDPKAFQLSLNKAKEMVLKPQALIATDPDADRLGVFLEDNGEYRSLNGNELGLLFTDFIIRKKGVKDYGNRWAILKTIVTTDAVKPMARDYNLRLYETLTGFKYLGNKSVELKSQAIDTLFSFEESFGYLYGDHAGDKDACSTAGLLALMLLEAGGGTAIFERLDKIHDKYGFYLERLLSHTAEGLNGMKRLKNFMQVLRIHRPVMHWEDGVIIKDYLEESGELKADVVEFLFQTGDRMIFRPSGTEPKIKAYINVNALDKKSAVNRIEWMQNGVKELFDSNLN